MTTTDLDPATSTEETRPARPLRVTIRRHRLLLLAVLCLLSSAVFLLAPSLRRTYRVQETMQLSPASYEGLPELTRLPGNVLKEISADTGGAQFALSGDAHRLTVAASASSRDAAIVRVKTAANRFVTVLAHRAQELGDSYRTGLVKRQEQLGDHENALAQQLAVFRGAHAGILPDDPGSVVAQFGKLSGELDDKQQRQRLVSEQITRLEAYKARAAQAGSQNLAPPAPLPPAPAESSAPASAGKAENDPEILALGAQLQMINDQIDEQLNSLHRTEQHPYVVDLRNKQAKLQKKLDAARERATAGKPPPPDVRLPAPAVKAADPTLLAAQQVDLQLESLRAEQSALADEIATLTGRRDAMQKQVDQVLPARREYEGLTGDLETTKKQRQAITDQLAEFDKRFPAGEGGAGTSPFVEITPLPASMGLLPVFPSLWLIYPAGVAVGLLAAWLLALLLHRMDRSLHSTAEAAEALAVPIVGTVSEIRTAGHRRVRRMWRAIGRPGLAIAMALLLLGSAAICMERLRNPSYTAGEVLTNPLAWAARSGS